MAQIDPPSDAIVGDWLSIPEVAEQLSMPVNRVKQLLRDRKLLGVQRPDGAPALPSTRAGAWIPARRTSPWQVPSDSPGQSAAQGGNPRSRGSADFIRESTSLSQDLDDHRSKNSTESQFDSTCDVHQAYVPAGAAGSVVGK